MQLGCIHETERIQILIRKLELRTLMHRQLLTIGKNDLQLQT